MSSSKEVWRDETGAFRIYFDGDSGETDEGTFYCWHKGTGFFAFYLSSLDVAKSVVCTLKKNRKPLGRATEGAVA